MSSSAAQGPDPGENLPASLTRLVGRERELAMVLDGLQDARLLTLAGVAGVGKTRLALEAASCLATAFERGVWLVELASLGDPALVPDAVAVAVALGLREQPGATIAEALCRTLRPRELLLILDNCEHLVGACAEFADMLLRACPRLRVLATSREPLRVVGERVVSLSPLPLPPSTGSLVGGLPASEAATYDAVRLFVERASAARADFALTDGNAAAVADVCRRLDGIPLAIELAATHVASLAPEQIAERLGDRFRLLSVGRRTGLPHHRTLWALVDWSYDLLSEPERALLRRLSAFSGGCTLDAAEAVSSGLGVERAEVAGLLGQLVDKSLVVAEQQGAGVRYCQLETLREYGRERLREACEAAPTLDRHLAWCLSLAERGDIQLRGHEQGAWLLLLEAEHDNLRAALAWSLAGPITIRAPGAADANRTERAMRGLELACALGWFWAVRGHFGEGRRWLEAMLAVAGEVPPSVRAMILDRAALIVGAQGEYRPATAYLDAALTLARRAGDDRVLADAARQRAYLAANEGDFAAAEALGAQSLAAARRLDDPWEVAQAAFLRSHVARHRGDRDEALALADESLALFRAAGDRRGVACALYTLGALARERGELDRAAELLGISLAEARALGNEDLASWAFFELGVAAALRSDRASASALLSDAALRFRDLGNVRGLANSILELGLLALERGVAERAARLLGAADVLREVVGAAWWPSQRARFDEGRAAARAALGEEAFATAWVVGRAMSVEEAAEYARAAPTTPAVPEGADRQPPALHPANGHGPGPEALSSRQQEVAALIGRGYTNGQIANMLVVSEFTVDAHVRNIFSRLQVRSRAQVAVWAARHGLIAPED